MGRALILAVTLCGCARGGGGAGGGPAGPGAYAALRAEIEAERVTLGLAYQRAGDEAERQAVRDQAARYLTARLTGAVLPAWDGTRWAMDGTSTVPGQGEIACGYFVSTALRDAGLRVERARLAQQAAEDIIRTLVPADRIRRFSRAPLFEFVAAVAAQGDGVYLVGLDYHVGFLVVERGEVYFHHSSYLAGRAVLREPALESVPLARSQYRVVGKLFTDRRAVEAWLEGAALPTTARSRG